MSLYTDFIDKGISDPLQIKRWIYYIATNGTNFIKFNIKTLKRKDLYYVNLEKEEKGILQKYRSEEIYKMERVNGFEFLK